MGFQSAHTGKAEAFLLRLFAAHILPSHSHQRSAVWTLLSFCFGYQVMRLQLWIEFCPAMHPCGTLKFEIRYKEHMEESYSGEKAKNPACVGLTNHWCPPKPFCHSPPQLSRGEKIQQKGQRLWGEIRTEIIPQLVSWAAANPVWVI